MQKRQFAGKLKQGRVSRFDLTQNANQAGEYTRCFYQLCGSETVYQEVPCMEPATRWRAPRECGRLRSEAALWTFILQNFTRLVADWQEIYILKKYCAHDHCAELVENTEERFCNKHT